METAIVVLLLVIGAVAGGLVVAAWKSDRPRRAWISDGVLHCDGPLTIEDVTELRRVWTEGSVTEDFRQPVMSGDRI